VRACVRLRDARASLLPLTLRADHWRMRAASPATVLAARSLRHDARRRRSWAAPSSWALVRRPRWSGRHSRTTSATMHVPISYPDAAPACAFACVCAASCQLTCADLPAPMLRSATASST
jgi:hypothetical protein